MLRAPATMLAARAMRLLGVASSRPLILPRRPISGAGAADAWINRIGLHQSLDGTMPWLVGQIQARSYARRRAAPQSDEDTEDDIFVEDIDDDDDEDDDDEEFDFDGDDDCYRRNNSSSDSD